MHESFLETSALEKATCHFPVDEDGERSNHSYDVNETQNVAQIRSSWTVVLGHTHASHQTKVNCPLL